MCATRCNSWSRTYVLLHACSECFNYRHDEQMLSVKTELDNQEKKGSYSCGLSRPLFTLAQTNRLIHSLYCQKNDQMDFFKHNLKMKIISLL